MKAVKILFLEILVQGSAVLELRRSQIFDFHAFSAMDDFGNELAVAILVVALEAENADRPGLHHQRGKFIHFFFGLRRLQMRAVYFCQCLHVPAARGFATVFRRA